ncbi:MAG: leucyl aminopeptidase [Acidimicrobiales bacterium]
MRLSGFAGQVVPDQVTAVGIPVHSDEDGPQYAVPVDELRGELPGLPGSLDPEWSARRGFKGALGETLVASNGGTDVVLVGIGDRARFAGDPGAESLRRASAAFLRAAGRGGTGLFLLPRVEGLPLEASAEATALGATLAAYRYERYRSEAGPARLDELTIGTGRPEDRAAVEEGVARGARIGESVALARDLINEPASSLTPARFADLAAARFDGVDTVSVEIWDERRIGEEHLGGLLGVARGSNAAPRLLRVEYRPADPLVIDGRTPRLALVGKGITFDSGGLSLKTATGMETMKTDMSGAAAVVAAVDAAAALGARIAITAIAPLTENMPGGSATKPGDVLTARNGKTIEVLNTDAEGRLVLADALSLAAETEPDAIVDLATLTGAAVVALGKDVAGLLGNDQVLIEDVRAAGARAGESLWQLPMPDDYRAHIDSEVADMKNVGRPGQAGTIAAAMLLREFVADVPWAHLDIAGTARSEDVRYYLTKGGTGFGVRTLVALATSEDFARALSELGRG